MAFGWRSFLNSKLEIIDFEVISQMADIGGLKQFGNVKADKLMEYALEKDDSVYGIGRLLIVLILLLTACDDGSPGEEIEQNWETRSITMCHTEAGDSFQSLELNLQDLPEHLLHGDGVPGGPVPNKDSFVFTERCLAIQDSNEGPCPKGMAHIDNFCIDRWEGSLQDLSPYEVPIDGVAHTARGVVPQGYISGDVADAACQAAGKRLCTSPEWLRTCKGPDSMTFPYGNTHIPSACNEGRESHPVVDLFGAAADWSASQMNDARINQLPGTLNPTGSNPVCMSVEGVYDLHGNLHEWVADAEGTFRGGFYVDARINGAGCLYRTIAHGSAYHDYSTGFRCCADAK